MGPVVVTGLGKGTTVVFVSDFRMARRLGEDVGVEGPAVGCDILMEVEDQGGMQQVEDCRT